MESIYEVDEGSIKSSYKDKSGSKLSISQDDSVELETEEFGVTKPHTRDPSS